MLRRMVTFFLLLLGVALMVLLMAYLLFPVDRGAFGLELAKSSLQLALVVVAGGLVSLVGTRFNYWRADQEKDRDEKRRRDENLDEFRKNLLERLNRAYASTKRARRLLRATALSGASASTPPYYGTDDSRTIVLLEPYDEHLQALNDTQLELEILAKDGQANTTAFSNGQEITTAIKDMDECLKKVIKEYETMRGGFFSLDPPAKNVSEMCKLSDFVRSRSVSSIFSTFVKQYERAAQAVQREILAFADSSARVKDQ
jgi:hypothetical protein